MPCAIITGVGGQDGSYLSELLLQKGYHVYGMIRRHSSMAILDRLKEVRKNPHFKLIYGDMTDISSIHNIFNEALANTCVSEAPLEVYNLAAQSHVKVSFETPIYTSNADGLGVLNLLEVIVSRNLTKTVRVYQASTSELYGSSAPPQNENTPFQPRSPYAIAKLYAYWMIRNYREAYNMYAVNGILFNHESERRGETFVSRKVTRAVADFYHNKDTILTLGNIHAFRDWGHAKDYVDAMWKMLQLDKPEDFVIATNESHTVKDFVNTAFDVIGVKVRWQGDGEEEKGYDVATGKLLVKVDPKYYRLTEVHHLRGDATKATNVLNWTPKTKFTDLVRDMVMYDIQTMVL